MRIDFDHIAGVGRGIERATDDVMCPDAHAERLHASARRWFQERTLRDRSARHHAQGAARAAEQSEIHEIADRRGFVRDHANRRISSSSHRHAIRRAPYFRKQETFSDRGIDRFRDVPVVRAFGDIRQAHTAVLVLSDGQPGIVIMPVRPQPADARRRNERAQGQFDWIHLFHRFPFLLTTFGFVVNSNPPGVVKAPGCWKILFA